MVAAHGDHFVAEGAQVHLDLGNLSEAKLHADEALKLAQTNHERALEGVGWMQLGRVVGRMEVPRIDRAEGFMRRGMKIFDELELKPSCAICCLCLGELYAGAGQKERALENLKKARAMFQEMGMDYYLVRTKKLLESLETGVS